VNGEQAYEAARCRVDELLKIVAPRSKDHYLCPSRATRRVQLGDHLVTDVCLWCSLVATERLSARLVSVASP
jgi:hypothetical protein